MLSLVNEKCIPAVLPELCIPRQKLMKKLKTGGRFIYIGAPAGSGKTVSALLWNSVCELEKRKSLWISLDAYDNVPSVFYKLLCAVFCSSQPENENMRSLLTDTAFSTSPVEHTVRLIAEMQPDESLYTLTFDDLHLLNNPDVLKSLPMVLKRLPNSFTVLFLSRNEPPEQLRALFRDEKTALIDREALRFSENELKAYYRSLGLVLTDEEAGLVLMATGGLAIGINAIAKSTGIKTPGIESSKTEYVFANYIREQLWESWDEGLRAFLLKTSVVDEMTEELAATLTGRKDAGKILHELYASNTFVSQVGKDLFRYHHLFLDFLREMAKESGIKLTALYKTAAKYYLDVKQYLVARHYAVQSGNDGIILKVIHQFNQYTNPLLDEYAAYSKIFSRDVLPKGICDRHPYLYTSIMEGAWISSDTKTVEHAWDKLREYLPVIALKYPRMLETVILEICVDYRKSFAGMIESFSRLPSIIRLSKRYQVSTLSLQLPFVHRSIRDFSELANDDLEKLAGSFGRLLYDLLPTVKLCFLSAFSLEKNRLDEALVYALKAKEASANISSPEIIFCACNHLSAVYLATGNEALLKASLAETEHYLQKSGARFLDRNFLAWKTKILLMNADKKAAQEWLDNYFVSDDEAGFEEHVLLERVPLERIPLYKVFQYFTTARAYMALNKGGKALGIIRSLIQFARDYRRPLDLVESLTLKACLEWASGSRGEAVVSLEEALLETQSRNFIRIIADEGSAIVPVLKRLVSSVQSENYTGALSRAYVTEILLAAHKTSQLYRGLTVNFKKSGKPVKLSKQQKKMLEFLAQGYKNAEIARISGLALPTVKGHLMLAYEKLEVNNSMDAILKARTLGFLSPELLP
ncbi:MAG: LuxR C-terminal-related transcriptional regulator [Treponema sp.]|jgi:LuxR family maltose regulon positive regulatory protein|nr:LuxR C-terminal-related transcriptional regulator [Treponema sp.]